jgi:plasmid segregation protein ParM
MRIAVDVGFGYTKAVSEQSQKVLFPSVVASKFQSSFGALLSERQKEDYEITIKTKEDEKNYYVGEAALLEGGTRMWETSAGKNRNLIPLIATSIFLLTTNEKNDIDLAVGLPIVYNSEENKQHLKTILEGFSADVVINDQKRSFTITSVFIFPQGAGSYFSALYDINGEVKNARLLNQPVGLLNIGYRTTDYLFMQSGKKGTRLNQALTGSMEEGMSSIHREIQQQLVPVLKREVAVTKIEQALSWNNGSFVNGSQTLSLKQYEDIASQRLAQKIIDQIKFKWNDEIHDMAAILIGGGGGDTLFPHIKSEFESTTKIDEANFSDALGFLAAQAQTMQLKKQKK